MITTKSESFLNILKESMIDKNHFFKNINFPYHGILCFDEIKKQLMLFNENDNNINCTLLFFNIDDIKDVTYINQEEIISYINQEYIPELLKKLFIKGTSIKYNAIISTSDIDQIFPYLGYWFSKTLFCDLMNQYIQRALQNDDDFDFSNANDFEIKNSNEQNIIFNYLKKEKIKDVHPLDVYVISIFITKYISDMDNDIKVKSNINENFIYNTKFLFSYLKNNQRYSYIYQYLLDKIEMYQFNIFQEIFYSFFEKKNLNRILIGKDLFSNEFIEEYADKNSLSNYLPDLFEANNKILLKLLKVSYVHSEQIKKYNNKFVVFTKTFTIDENNKILNIN